MFKLRDIKNKATDFLGGYEKKDPATLAAAEQAVGGLLILDGFIGIDNPFGGRKRAGIFGSLLGVVLGIAIVFFGGFFFNLFGTQRLTADSTGQVTAVGAPQTHSSTDSNGNQSTSTTCSMTVQYTVNDHVYEQTTKSESSSNCSAGVGTTIDIKYNPANPAEFDTASTVKIINTMKRFMPLVGLFVLIVSGFTFIVRLLSIIFGWKILRRGRKLAQTLPNGGSLSSQISKIRDEFKGTLFNNGGVAGAIEKVVDGDNAKHQ